MVIIVEMVVEVVVEIKMMIKGPASVLASIFLYHA